MNNTKNYHFSSNSTGPLEHKFGYARVKSNDINTLSRFILVISSIQKEQNEWKIEEINNFNIEAEKIRGRTNNHGVSIQSIETSSQVKEYNFDLPYSPCDVAKTFLIKAGFPLDSVWMINDDDVIYWTKNLLKQFLEDVKPRKKKQRIITLNTFSYGTDNCKRAKALITGKPVNIPNRKTYNYMQRKELFDQIFIEKLRGKLN